MQQNVSSDHRWQWKWQIRICRAEAYGVCQPFKKKQKTIAFEQAYIQNGDYIIGVGVRSFNAVQDIENDVLKKDLYKILNSIKFSGNL